MQPRWGGRMQPRWCGRMRLGATGRLDPHEREAAHPERTHERELREHGAPAAPVAVGRAARSALLAGSTPARVLGCVSLGLRARWLGHGCLEPTAAAASRVEFIPCVPAGIRILCDQRAARAQLIHTQRNLRCRYRSVSSELRYRLRRCAKRGKVCPFVSRVPRVPRARPASGLYGRLLPSLLCILSSHSSVCKPR